MPAVGPQDCSADAGVVGGRVDLSLRVPGEPVATCSVGVFDFVAARRLLVCACQYGAMGLGLPEGQYGS